MKKRFIGGILATAILIPAAAFAAPTQTEMPNRTPLTAEQVKAEEVGKTSLEKLYSAFPETKSFEIIDVSRVQSEVSVDLSEITRMYASISRLVKSNKRPVSLAYRKPAIFRSNGAWRTKSAGGENSFLVVD